MTSSDIQTGLVEPGSSVCVLSTSINSISDENWISTAREKALNEDLPLAVVFLVNSLKGLSRLEAVEVFKRLRLLEARYNSRSVPLMLLFGSYQQVLNSFIYHTKPDHIFIDNPDILKGLGQSNAAEIHLYKKSISRFSSVGQNLELSSNIPWPGTVIAIDELQPLIDTFISTLD